MIDAEAASLTSLRGKLGTHKQHLGIDGDTEGSIGDRIKCWHFRERIDIAQYCFDRKGSIPVGAEMAQNRSTCLILCVTVQD